MWIEILDKTDASSDHVLEVAPEHDGDGEESNEEGGVGTEEDPVQLLEELEVGLTVKYQATVGIVYH